MVLNQTAQKGKKRNARAAPFHNLLYSSKKRGGIYKRDEVEIDDLQKVSLVDGDDTLSSDPKIFA